MIFFSKLTWNVPYQYFKEVRIIYSCLLIENTSVLFNQLLRAQEANLLFTLLSLFVFFFLIDTQHSEAVVHILSLAFLFACLFNISDHWRILSLPSCFLVLLAQFLSVSTNSKLLRKEGMTWTSIFIAKSWHNCIGKVGCIPWDFCQALKGKILILFILKAFAYSWALFSCVGLTWN